MFRLSLPLTNGRAERQRSVATAEGGPHQAPQHVLPIGVAPAEVVENGDALGIGADGHAVAHRFVDGRGGHPVRIEIAVPRVHAAGDHQPAPRFKIGADDGRVGGAVLATPTSGLTTLPACTS